MSHETKKILIAEDNPGLARVLTFKFKSMGFDPVSCANGGAALEAFRKDQFDAVVTDQEMPVMSGTELIQKIRESHPDLPCFMVTGRQLELSRDPLVIKLQVREIFAKPFSPATVVKAVSAAIIEIESETPSPDSFMQARPVTTGKGDYESHRGPTVATAMGGSSVGNPPGANV